MRSVLILSYFFPPMGGGGVQRTLKFVKYLPDCQWRPIVVTARQTKMRLTDEDLAAEVPSQAHIVRTADLGLPGWLPWRLRAWITRWLLVVDEHIGWYFFALRDAMQIIREESVQAIYSTSAPYTAHLIGYRLYQRSNLAWIADFRDPWVDNFSTNFPTQFHRRLAEEMEGKVLQVADRVLVVSEPMRQALLARHPRTPPAKVIVLPNGYDPEDYSALPSEAIQTASETGRFLIVYSGSFYGRRQTPQHFLQALKQSLEDQIISRERLRVRFVGNTGKHTLDLIVAMGLQDVCQVTGYLPHRRSLVHLMAGDVLLLIIGRGPGSQAVFTGKIFEYLASGKTILCLADPGAAADLVQEAHAGIVVDPQDIQAIAAQITHLYQQWEGGRLNLSQPNPDVVQRYDRRLLTTRLADLLNEIATPGGQSP